VARLGEAKRERRLDDELRNLARIPLIICERSATSRSTPTPPT